MLTTIQTKLQFITNDDEKDLNNLMLRDMRVMNRILGIMQFEYSQGRLFTRSSKSKKWRVKRKDLAEIMLSTANRPTVRYDLKAEFVNISHNELMECIDNAAEMFKSYLELKDKGVNVSFPKILEPLTRRIGYRRFSIDQDHAILSIIDSRKSNYRLVTTSAKRVRHDYLDMNYFGYERLEDYLDLGKAKSVVITRSDGNYFAHITIEIKVKTWKDDENKPLAVIGIDLGITKTIAAVLYTNRGIVERKVFNDRKAKNAYLKVEQDIATLQQQLHLSAISQYISDLKYYRKKISDQTIEHGITQVLDRIFNDRRYQPLANQLISKLIAKPSRNRYEERLLIRLQQLVDHADESTSNLVKQLRRLKTRRAQIKDDMIKQLCSQLQDYVVDKRENYQIYLSLGNVKGIRNSARRGNGKKQLRKKVNKWAYFKLSNQLAHNLAKIGMDDRLINVREVWTSQFCYRCNERGSRPSQSKFICHSCGLKINADFNGAANIAKRGILYKKLVSFKDMMDQWAIPARAVKRVKSVK